MKTVGRYILGEEIGRGSMGTVYKGSDPLIDRAVALKLVNLSRLDDGTIEPRMRFLREARAAGRLSHPGIVTVHDVGEFEDVAFIVMEFVEGRSLADLLEKNVSIPMRTAAKIVAETADALAFAHSQGVVHRDVKPGNIMLTRLGGVKIADFGIARIDTGAKTRTGILVGSPGYMSPEQLSGKPVDGRSDVFSLGMVLYELLTGRGPFDADRRENVFELMQNITRRPHVPPSKVNPKVPVSIDAVIDRALAKSPDERYQSAAQMARDLRVAITRDVPTEPGEPDIAKLAASADVLMPEFDLFSEDAARTTVSLSPPTIAPTKSPDAGSAKDTGLLSRLRSQAEAIENKSLIDSTTMRQLNRDLQVERLMRAAFAYYQELVRYLGVVKPEVGYDYPLEGVGTLARPRVADAFVDSRQRRAEGRAWTELVLLTAVAVSPTELRVGCTPEMLPRLTDKLNAANLPYTASENGGTVVTVAGEITLYARIMADRARGRIAFLCRNVGGFGTSNYVVDANAIDESVFEEFAKYLLGQPNRFGASPPSA